MILSTTYKGAIADLDAIVERKLSETHFKGEVGDEKADYTENFRIDGTVRSTSVLTYEGPARAADAAVDAAMILSTTYKGAISDLDAIVERKLSETHFKGDVGDEKADYTENFRPDTTVRSTSVLTYEGNARAADAAVDDAMILSTTYKGAIANLDAIVERKLSETHFKGEVGDEKADYTENFRPDTTVRSTSVLTYEGNNRAADAAVDDAMVLSTTYRGSIADLDAIVERKLSETHFKGEVGDEKADYTENFRVDGTVIAFVC